MPRPYGWPSGLACCVSVTLSSPRIEEQGRWMEGDRGVDGCRVKSSQNTVTPIGWTYTIPYPNVFWSLCFSVPLLSFTQEPHLSVFQTCYVYFYSFFTSRFPLVKMCWYDQNTYLVFLFFVIFQIVCWRSGPQSAWLNSFKLSRIKRQGVG